VSEPRNHDGPWAKWKCAACGWIGLHKKCEDACPQCKSEDVFPLYDGGWPDPDSPAPRPPRES
jgi:hypothetical protein